MVQRIYLAGRVWVRKNGLLVAQGNNLVTDLGVQAFIDLLTGDNAVQVTHLGLGETATAPDGEQTQLAGEFARVAMTTSRSGFQFVATAPVTGVTGSVKEMGLFSAATAGVMFCRFITATIPLQPNDNLEVNWIMELLDDAPAA